MLVGIRNLDDIEKELVKASRVHVFTMKEIDRLGIAQVMERALTLAGRGTGGIHVSFDMDVCDPAIAPGVGTAVKGGLDYREAHVVMEMVAESGRLTSLDLVEVNPTLDLQEYDGGTRNGAGAVGDGETDPLEPPDLKSRISVSASRLLEHVFERVHQHDQRVGLLDQPRARADHFEIRRLRSQTREDDHRNFRRHRHDDLAPRAALQPQIDDGGVGTMLPDRIETFVGGFGCHHRVLPHLKELDERLTYCAVVFHDEHCR